jgi:hypothetical protein
MYSCEVRYVAELSDQAVNVECECCELRRLRDTWCHDIVTDFSVNWCVSVCYIHSYPVLVMGFRLEHKSFGVTVHCATRATVRPHFPGHVLIFKA